MYVLTPELHTHTAKKRVREQLEADEPRDDGGGGGGKRKKEKQEKISFDDLEVKKFSECPHY